MPHNVFLSRACAAAAGLLLALVAACSPTEPERESPRVVTDPIAGRSQESWVRLVISVDGLPSSSLAASETHAGPELIFANGWSQAHGWPQEARILIVPRAEDVRLELWLTPETWPVQLLPVEDGGVAGTCARRTPLHRWRARRRLRVGST
jgi:hypothetical protein